MVNCLDLLKEKGYSLSGYSGDTIVILQETETDNEDECRSLLAWLEATYG